MRYKSKDKIIVYISTLVLMSAMVIIINKITKIPIYIQVENQGLKIKKVIGNIFIPYSIINDANLYPKENLDQGIGLNFDPYIENSNSKKIFVTNIDSMIEIKTAQYNLIISCDKRINLLKHLTSNLQNSYNYHQ